MSTNFKKTIIIIVAVLGVVLIGLFSYEKNTDEKVKQEKGIVAQPENIQVNLSEPTGNPDDILKSALAELDSEAKLENNEENTAQDLVNNNAEASAFSSIYEENSF